jgi:LysM repeat protein
MWTKSACVVLAWSIVLILAAVGTKAPVRTVQANRAIAGRTQITLTTAISVAAPAHAATQPTATYVVQPGDTLSGIAARFALAGGWSALYAANRMLIGSDPNDIQPGMVLSLPGTAATRYTVVPGDTLSGIATALAVPGGWQALYAANRGVIGPDPNAIQPGTALSIPRLAQSGPLRISDTHLAVPPPLGSEGPSTSGPPAAAGRQQRSPAKRATERSATMPRWLTAMLVTVALLIGAAFLAEPVAARARKRRREQTRPSPVVTAFGAAQADRGQRTRATPRVILAEFDRLVVAHCAEDDTVYVLRPADADPVMVLRVARLVLAEDPYQALADQLGVPASQPLARAVSERPYLP